MFQFTQKAILNFWFYTKFFCKHRFKMTLNAHAYPMFNYRLLLPKKSAIKKLFANKRFCDIYNENNLVLEL
jgi:hypothetical protein